MNYKRTYRRLISLYPKDHQFRFAPEMAVAFEAAIDEHIHSDRRALARFLFTEFSGLLIGAVAEWLAKWRTDVSVRSRHLPDLRMMPLPWVPREARFQSLRKHRCSPDTSR